MRLSERMKKLITAGIRESFGEIEILLFGSRTDDSKKGGDIDIALKSDLNSNDFRARKVKFHTFLARMGFDLKIDVVQYHESMDKLLKGEIEEKGVAL